MAGVSKRKFRCLRGFSYGPDGKYAFEPGDLVEALPAEYVGWMLAEGTITEVTDDAESDREVSGPGVSKKGER